MGCGFHGLLQSFVWINPLFKIHPLALPDAEVRVAAFPGNREAFGKIGTATRSKNGRENQQQAISNATQTHLFIKSKMVVVCQTGEFFWVLAFIRQPHHRQPDGLAKTGLP
jgi:hypothetical protein